MEEFPEAPAPKKRRFFKDDLDDDPILPSPSIESPLAPPTPIAEPVSPSEPPEQPEQLTFAEQLLAVLAEDLPAHVVGTLEDVSGGNIERAVNMYFDGSWEKHVRDTKPRGLMTTTQAKKPLEPTLNNFITRTTAHIEQPRKTSPISCPPGPWARRYLGSLGVEGWAISSGTNILKAGDPLLIERQNPKPPPPKPTSFKSQSNAKSKTIAPPPRFPLPAKQQKQHMLVRFTTLSGKEIGRLPQETANYVSVLLDQNLCAFEGTCIFSPEKLRTGDNILIQLRCYLLPKIFKPMKVSKDERPGVWEVSETEEEKALKLRRVSLLHLFKDIGMEPLRTDPMTRQIANSRDQLILAAQINEPPQAAAGMSRSSSGQSSADTEEEEGKEVAEDTLNMLYKKAQMYDPEMPTMDPPCTFKFELRKYQKQALCWMVGKESGGDKDVRKQQSLNPLWEEYEWLNEDSPATEKENVNGVEMMDKFYMNPYSGEMSLTMPTQESVHKGGILADGNSLYFFAKERNGPR